jgi:hypothetical protein
MRKKSLVVLLVLFLATLVVISVSASAEEVVTVVEPVIEEFDLGVWIKELFTPALIASIISVFGTVAVVLKLAVSLKNLAVTHKFNTDNIETLVREAVTVSSLEQTEKSINLVINPLLEKIKGLEKNIQTQAKMSALSQDTSPTGKMAVVNFLASMNTEEAKETAKQVERVLTKQEEDKQETKVGKNKKLKEIKKRNTLVL